MEEKLGGRVARIGAWMGACICAALSLGLLVSPQTLWPADLCEEPCRAEGRCEPRHEGWGEMKCYAANDDACARSSLCKAEGRCHYEPLVSTGRCVALTVEDCLNARACREKGRCSLEEDGSCVVSAAGCTRSETCERDGICHLPSDPEFDDGERGECVAGETSRQTWCDSACELDGACSRRGNRCVATSEQACRESSACAELGRCALDRENGVCVADDAADCAASERCEHYPHCTSPDHVDFCLVQARPCEVACRLYGWCGFQEGDCVARSDEDCMRSRVCEVNGDCRMTDGLCLPASPGDCHESLACKYAGFCTFDAPVFFGWNFAGGGNCHVASSQDCSASLGCEKFGRCEAKSAAWCEGTLGELLCSTNFCAAPNREAVMPCASRFITACVEKNQCVLHPDGLEDPSEDIPSEDTCISIEDVRDL